MKQLLQYWPLLNVVLSFFLAWLGWSFRQMARNAIDQAVSKMSAQFDALKGAVHTEVDGLDRRVNTHDTAIGLLQASVGELEQDILNLPTKADLSRVEGEVKLAVQEASAANRGIGRIENLFLTRGVERV